VKRFLLFAGLLVCTGCFTAAPPADVMAPVSVPIAKTYPPVMPEQITETNGRQVAQALMEELDREAQQNGLTPSPR
jgi:hypothetical protein